MAGGKKARLNLELDAVTKRRLDDLKVDTDAPSITDVIRRALHLYEIVTATTAQGGTFVLREEDGAEKEIVIL